MQIKVLWVGRTRNASLAALCSDYAARINRMGTCSVVEIRDPGKRRELEPAQRLRLEGAEIAKLLPAGGRTVALAATGTELSSEGFARWIGAEQNRGCRDLRFVIGGIDGIAEDIMRRANLRLSLGRMTWTHEMGRVLLLEQIYRSFCILNRIPYHR